MKKLVSNTAVPEIIVVSEGIEEKRCKIIQNLSDNNGLKRQVLWLTKASKNASHWKFRETAKHTKEDKSMHKNSKNQCEESEVSENVSAVLNDLLILSALQ